MWGFGSVRVLDGERPPGDAGCVASNARSGDPFASELIWKVLTEVCRAEGLPGDGAQLLRLGENAMFRLRDQPLVVRIGRSMQRQPVMDRELCVARWLDDQGVPVARPYDGVQQPIVVMDYPVTVWNFVEAGSDPPGVDDLAVLLRQVHALRDGPCQVPQFDPLGNTESRLRGIDGLRDEDRTFLLTVCDRLRAEYETLEFVLPYGFVHGDAHIGNLLGGAGRAVLTDFEAAVIGPREWDLTPVAVSRTRMGLAADTYDRFVDVYGFDVIEWVGFDVLRQIRELNMTTWLAQNLSEGQHVADEVALRITSIRDGDRSAQWHAF